MKTFHPGLAGQRFKFLTRIVSGSFRMELLLSVIFCILVDTVATESWNFAGVNIAYLQRTAQSPGVVADGISSRAVDGNTNTSYENDSCTHTNGIYNTKASWTVYLNGTYALKGIRVFNRKNLRERLENFKIIGGPSATILYDDETAIPKLYKNSRIDVIIDLDQNFSSVTIEIPARTDLSYLTLCEVQIFSENHDCSMLSPDGHLVTTLRQGTGYKNTAKGLVSTWTVLDFKCDGHFKLEGSNAITCVPGGLYNTSVPTCIVKCNKPPDVINGQYMLTNRENYAVGDTLTWTCNKCYKSEQNRSRRCQVSSKWTGDRPNCSRITCAFPGQVSNGSLQVGVNKEYTSGETECGNIVNVLCAEGFRANVPNINCKEDGKWNILPLCIRIECKRLEKLIGGYYIYMFNDAIKNHGEHVYEYGTTATPVCNETLFKPSDDIDAKRMCDENGNWTGNGELCVALCTTPSITQGYFEGQENDVYEVGQSITAVCLEGFELNSKKQTTIMCQKNHTWDKPIPSCIDRPTEGQQASYVAGIAGGVPGAFIVGVIVGMALIWLAWKMKMPSKQHSLSSTYKTTNPSFSSNIDGDHAYAELEIATLS